jgi:LytS/YehU family sensor histidine kinase
VQLPSSGPARTAALLTTVLGSAFIGYLLWLRQRLANEAAARARAQQLAAESELRLLRAQIEPHMLFNTLANLRSLVDDDPTLAKSMIDRLIVYLRAALAASRSEWTTLEQEFAQLEAYLGIMAVRLGARLTHSLELPGELRGVRIPPMLLQPLVENAIKHGIEPKVGGGRVEVRAQRRVDGAVEVIVGDTGVGGAAITERKDDSDRSRYGLAHVRERLRSVYGDAAVFELAPGKPQGTWATVRIPA